jgi:hypothetical protein
MGMNVGALNLIIRLKEQGYIPDHSMVAELGSQQLSNGALRAREQLEKLGRLFGVHSEPLLPAPLPTTTNERGRELLSSDAPLAAELWRWLGLKSESFDINDSPGTTQLDLNFDDVPIDMAGRFHLVTNFGTTEHVANQLNAFKIVHDLTALGGIMIHKVPSQGTIDHGLVHYTPQFFWMLARSNDYGWLWFDFAGDAGPHAMADNLIDSIRPFRPEIYDFAKTYQVTDCAITAVFIKKKETSYVAPIDVPNDTVSDSDILLERYWSVLRRPG